MMLEMFFTNKSDQPLKMAEIFPGILKVSVFRFNSDLQGKFFENILTPLHSMKQKTSWKTDACITPLLKPPSPIGGGI